MIIFLPLLIVGFLFLPILVLWRWQAPPPSKRGKLRRHIRATLAAQQREIDALKHEIAALKRANRQSAAGAAQADAEPEDEPHV